MAIGLICGAGVIESGWLDQNEIEAGLVIW